MNDLMNASSYELLYHEMFLPSYKGYIPTVAEAPNGDGKVDVQKRYAHLAHKYGLPSKFCELLFDLCLKRACEYAGQIDIPIAFYPSAEDSTLRLLEYPPGATSAEHTDFDLFTINLYRSHPDLLIPAQAEVHYGELAEIITGGRLKATPHHVLAHSTQTQRSAVFFAMPSLDAVLPTGITVREWLTERKTRSRVYK